MKKISKQTIILTLTFLLSSWTSIQAQSYDAYIQQELVERLSRNWSDIERVVFSKHRDDGHLVIAMHVIGTKEDHERSPRIDVDFKTSYNKDYIFAYQFDCHRVILEDARAIFKNFRADSRKVKSLDKNINFYDNIPMEHRYILYKLAEASNELIKICGSPKEL
ncbi:MAG TPA: hypothetical protein PKC21_01530 [Oligoflexia bacterium]|nr:hypothetical protein [Oligoflexia bacterium]HMR24012.1 hypothetical protein [Oligoflexia bacterium]